MAPSTHALSHLRTYSTRHLPRDPHYRLKATLATSYVVSALALPFVPPLLETRRAKADGSYLTRYGECVLFVTDSWVCKVIGLVWTSFTAVYWLHIYCDIFPHSRRSFILGRIHIETAIRFCECSMST
ncbi:hypothetical protein BKA58DRAFT_4981 [Alternaria rosae]|uniref:uncharacterized protein n=1 Tax=Alternaria rosae TaxID=1187941 RepID=UPI001E8EC868|nr:uncharacterized protein BKA58DRAFT_4981 [Alternaria rosae]KAH6881565.1 hypothetical protein BKA58DRAFT_4981 [Alternaria rosae]